MSHSHRVASGTIGGLVVPLRNGWEPVSSGDFYPSDLPEDWRLSYFANEIDAVLVPSRLWRSAAPETLARWREDVPRGFSFFMEEDPRSTPGSECSMLSELLGDAFKGLVPPVDERPQPWLRPPGAAGSGSSESGGLACRVPDALRRDLRRARVWLDALEASPAGSSLLLLLGSVEIDVVRQWQVALDLLGLSRRP